MKPLLCRELHCRSEALQVGCNGRPTKNRSFSGCSSAWLERLVWDQEVARSNRVTPTGSIAVEQKKGCRAVVE